MEEEVVADAEEISDQPWKYGVDMTNQLFSAQIPPSVYSLMPANLNRGGGGTPFDPPLASQILAGSAFPSHSPTPVASHQSESISGASMSTQPLSISMTTTAPPETPILPPSPNIPTPIALGFKMGTEKSVRDPGSLPEIDMSISRQPPVEVRTRTPSENRTFSSMVRVRGPFQLCKVEYVKVGLVYHIGNGRHEVVANREILGGTKLVAINSQGQVPFNNLSIAEASTKHREHEFALEYVLVCRKASGQLYEATVALFSNPFYAYSHKKVLTRRKIIRIQSISPHFGPYTGGIQVHITGRPFIGGPSLTCVLRTPHGDVAPLDVQLCSESGLFFTLPPYPMERMDNSDETPQALKAVVQVSNNGRHFSNPLEFYYAFKEVAME